MVPAAHSTAGRAAGDPRMSQMWTKQAQVLVVGRVTQDGGSGGILTATFRHPCGEPTKQLLPKAQSNASSGRLVFATTPDNWRSSMGSPLQSSHSPTTWLLYAAGRARATWIPGTTCRLKGQQLISVTATVKDECTAAQSLEC